MCRENNTRSIYQQRKRRGGGAPFYLTSGLKSQILGEDQILTQVKEALSMSRDEFTTDSVLEVLFRMAVTAGKKIKTEVPFSHGNPSVIHQPSVFWKRAVIMFAIKSVW